METIVIADTDVVIDFFTGTEPYATVITDLANKDRLALTSVTVFELYAGITGKKRLNQIDRLISVLPVVPLEKAHAKAAAKIYGKLRKKGKLIGNQDILIAGICITHDMPLVTRNTSHFSRISGLNLFSFK